MADITITITDDTAHRMKHYAEHVLAHIWTGDNKDREEARTYAVEIVDQILFDPNHLNDHIAMIKDFKDEFQELRKVHHKH